MGILVSLLLIHAGAVVLKKKTAADGSLSYFTVMCAGIMVLYAGALINMLRPAAILFYGAIVLAVAVFAIKGGFAGTTKAVKEYIDFPVAANGLFSLLMVLMYYIRQPRFYYWDEYSFWGPSAKFVKYFHRVYSIEPTSVGMSGAPCGNSLLNYLITFFTQGFEDWYLLAAYTAFYLAVFAVAASLVRKKTGSFSLTAITFLALFLSPFMSTFHTAAADYSSLMYAYGTSMVDFNIPVAFLGAIVAYMYAPDKKWYLLPLMFVVTVKNTSIFFALLAVAVICCFILFDRSAGNFSFKKAAIAVVITAIVPVVVYLAWNVHLRRFSQPRTTGPFMLKDPNPPQIQQTVTPEISHRADNSGATVLSIFIPSLRTDRYNYTLDSMAQQFASEDITLFGKDKYMVAGLIAIGVATIIMADKKSRIAVALINMGLGAGAYVYVIAISYFITFFADGMIEYPRYMTSYYFSWMLVTAVMFAVYSNRQWLVQAVFTAAATLTVLFVTFTGVSRTVFDAPDNAYATHIRISEEMKDIHSLLKKGDRVYVVMGDQNTMGGMHYNYHILPALNIDTKNTGIDFSISFRESIDWSSDRTYYHVASPQTFAQVIQYYFDYVYVVQPDREMVASYGHLFTGGMTPGSFYKVTDNAIPMQEVIFDE